LIKVPLLFRALYESKVNDIVACPMLCTKECLLAELGGCLIIVKRQFNGCTRKA